MLINGEEQIINLYPLESNSKSDLEILYQATEIQRATSITNVDGFNSTSDTDIVVTGESTITLTPQSGVIDGLSFWWNENIQLPIEAGDNFPRIDLIVLEKNQAKTQTNVVVKKGTMASNPVAPSIEQTTLGYYELPIMEVYVNASASSISTANITDLRNPITKEQVAENTANINTLYSHLIGVALPFMGTESALPDGAVILSGQEISRTQYPIVFSRLGVTWGHGDGVYTFNLPDGRNKSFYAMGDDGSLDYQEENIAVGDVLQTSIINATGRFNLSDGYMVGTSGVFYSSNRSYYHNANSNSSSKAFYGYLDLSRQVPTGDTNKPNSFVGNWIMFLG